MTDAGSRKALGRGLAALFGDEAPAGELDGTAVQSEGGVRELPIEQLLPNERQPRRRFDEETLEELAASMRTSGVLQPILVRPHPSQAEAFEIVAGERRWRAAQRARLHRIPVLVRTLSDRETLEVALIENVQRQDLSPIEEAGGYQRLIDEFGYSQEQLGRELGRSRSHVANMLRLLSLPEGVRTRVDSGELSSGHARALLAAADPDALAEIVASRGLSVRQTEWLVQNPPGPGAEASSDSPKKSGGRPAKDADTLALEESLTSQLGLKVDIGFDGKGGTVTLRYKSLEQLDEIARRLSGS